MHALYIQLNTYHACVEWSAILGGPFRLQKLADPELNPDDVPTENKVQRMIGFMQKCVYS